MLEIDVEEDAGPTDEDALDAVAELEDWHPEERLAAFEEHGAKHVECLDCGRQWTIVEVASELGAVRWDAELVSEGDGHCLDESREG